jgi:hypothetical protein
MRAVDVVAKNLWHADTRMVENTTVTWPRTYAIKAGAPRYRVRNEKTVVPLL